MTPLPSDQDSVLMRRLLLWLPLGGGGLLALLVLLLGALPLFNVLQVQTSQQRDQLEQEQRLPQIRADLARVGAQQLTAERQQRQLLTLIAGSGDLVTFLAQADNEAQRHGVQLQLFEPTPALPAAEGEEADPLKAQAKGTRKQRQRQQQAQQQAKAAITSDPLRKAGLNSTLLLLTARGRYPQVLAFLRGMEALSLLVVYLPPGSSGGFSLGQPIAGKGATVPVPSTNPQASTPPTGVVELKMAIALYSAKAQK
jgi:type IV pilus assembly protein PilO